MKMYNSKKWLHINNLITNISEWLTQFFMMFDDIQFGYCYSYNGGVGSLDESNDLVFQSRILSGRIVNKNRPFESCVTRETNKLVIKYKNKIGMNQLSALNVEEIIYITTCKDNSHYLEFYCSDGMIYRPVHFGLTKIDSLVNYSGLFAYTHRSFIVNIKFIKSVKDGKNILLSDKSSTELPLSRRHRLGIYKRLSGSKLI